MNEAEEIRCVRHRAMRITAPFCDACCIAGLRAENAQLTERSGRLASQIGENVGEMHRLRIQIDKQAGLLTEWYQANCVDIDPAQGIGVEQRCIDETAAELANA